LQTKNGSSAQFKRPKFHLLIPTPAKKPAANLCKTLLSAAVLNYPPPTLIRYYEEEGEHLGYDVVKKTLNFLQGKEAHEHDLVLIIEEGETLKPYQSLGLSLINI
jgi:hypothetical protein